jgi:damage-control phosphatase, subfamily I
LKATLDCLECIAAQALRTARVATDDPKVQRTIFNEVVSRISAMDCSESPAALSLVVYDLTIELTGNADPYGELKREQNELALELEPELRELVAQSTDPLATALHLSAAGNIIDLGVQHSEHIDVRGAIKQSLEERFAVDHSEAFLDSLSRCKDLLFLLDNAGEIVFDKILIEELQKHTTVTAVVKGAPILNDVLLADAEQVGLTAVCDVIDNGGAFIGSPLELIPDSFRQRMEQADVLIGKGQGNYETIDEFPGDVFLILRAKCEIIAEHMGVKYGQVGLISTRLRSSMMCESA